MVEKLPLKFFYWETKGWKKNDTTVGFKIYWFYAKILFWRIAHYGIKKEFV